MSNFAGALKGEIQRLARKEVRATVKPLKKLVSALRRRVAQQRRHIAELQRATRRAVSTARAPEERASDESQIRFSPAWVKRHRKKLKMSRRVYAKLVGVSAQSIFGWESGRTRPRRSALQAWRRIRSMGVRELKGLIGGEKPSRKGRRGRPVKRGRPAKRGRKRVARRGRPARRRAVRRRTAKKK